MTEFTQVYLRRKIFLLGSSLAFSLKEDPVRCAKVCDESWVILMNYRNDEQITMGLKLISSVKLGNKAITQDNGNLTTYI